MRRPPGTYYNSLTEICGPDGRIFGTGAVISATQVVTCAHVVAAALPDVDENGDFDDIGPDAFVGVRRAYLDGVSAKPRCAQVRKFYGRQDGSGRADLALLELVDGRFWSERANEAIAQFAEVDESDPGAVFVVGFPEDASETVGKSAEAEYLLGGLQPNSWINAQSIRGHGSEIRSGFSGAPAWSWSKGGVVGLITEADSSRRSATLIPTSCVRRIAPLPIDDGAEPAADSHPQGVRPKKLTPLSFLRYIFDRCFPRLHYWLTARLALFADPPERAILNEYLSELAAELKDKIAEKTYIPPPTKHVSNLPAGWTRKPALLQQLVKEIAGVSGGGDAASAQISALSRRSRRVRRLIYLLTRSPEPLILLGEPGAGKSLTLQQASMHLAEQNARRVSPKIILFVSLGRWQPVERPDISSVEDLVKGVCPKELRPYLRALEEAGRLIVVFDGLDEMSRERYTEHTAALSKYAESRRDQVHTLFSCRIADFSPDFQHKRLVLLPFELAQIRAYLHLQFGRAPVVIDGSCYKIGALAKEIYSGALPFQARNPYVLSLLCIYIQEKQSFPNKRVDLLNFYYRYNFERKKEEIDTAAIGFWEGDRYYQLWGKIALEITQRNQGTDIGLHEIRRLLGAEATSTIEVGRLCGVLQQSFSTDPPLLRFEHHRAQEYFAAWSIVHRGSAFDWRDKLDVPRWQETLVNVIQMGGGLDALQVLREVLDRASPEIALIPNRVDRMYAEALASERVELAVRIARDLPMSSEREKFFEDIAVALAWFMEHGNAVSRVKMLRLAQAYPRLATLDTIRSAIEDKSAWVRNQAYIVSARLVGRVTATTVPDELMLDFASGNLVGKLPSFFTLARQLRNKSVFGVAALGAGLLVLRACALALLGSFILFAARAIIAGDNSEPTDLRRGLMFVFSSPEYKWSIYIVASGLFVSCLIWSRRSWLYAQAIGIVAVAMPVLAISMWYTKSIALLPAVLFGGVFLLIPVTLVGIALVMPFSAMFGAVLFGWTRSFRYFRRQIISSWVEEEFWSDPLPSMLLMVLVGCGFAGLAGLAGWVGSLATISRLVWHFPYLDETGDVELSIGLYVLAALILIGGILSVGRRTRGSGLHKLCWSFAGFLVFCILLIHVEWIIIPYLFGLIDEHFGTWLASGAAVLLGLVFFVAISAGIFLGGQLVYRWLKYRLDQLRDAKIDPHKWEQEIRSSSSVVQARLLDLGTPERLSLSAPDFLSRLVGLEAHIKEDPALTAYGSKCAQTLELIRQGRAG